MPYAWRVLGRYKGGSALAGTLGGRAAPSYPTQEHARRGRGGDGAGFRALSRDRACASRIRARPFPGLWHCQRERRQPALAGARSRCFCRALTRHKCVTINVASITNLARTNRRHPGPRSSPKNSMPPLPSMFYHFLCHELVGVVNALAALVAKSVGECGRQVGRVRGSELPDGVGHPGILPVASTDLLDNSVNVRY